MIYKNNSIEYIMVYSNINSTVFYKESENINDEDIGYNSTLYEMEIHGKKVLIVFGKMKYSFIQRNIVFLPIYLVVYKKALKQIGVIEFDKNVALDLYNDENDIDVEKIEEPIIFGFFDQNYIDKNSYESETFLKEQDKMDKDEQNEKEEDNEQDDDNDDDDETEEIFTLKSKPSNITPEMQKVKKNIENGVFNIDEKIQTHNLTEETENDAKQIQDSFEVTPNSNWIQIYMKNENFEIQDVEDNGDCFFAVIRDAFKQIGHNTTVAKLRALVAHEVTEDIFEEHKNLYTSLVGQIQEYNKELSDIKNKIEKEMNQRAKNAKDNKFELKAILEETKELKEKHKLLLKNKQVTQSMIDEDVTNFDKIHSIEDFRAFIQTSQYWADSWSISVLEELLNVKLIVFSERSFMENDLHNVLLCGEVNKNIGQKQIFEPDYYICTCFRGDHYKSISYKEKKILKFHEIPYHTKTLILNKCLERNSGSFYIIPDFKNMKTKLGLIEEEEEDDTDNITDSNIYDKNIVFEFYRYSNNAPKPGKGVNEKIPSDKRSSFIDLAKISSWRRKLDDSWDESPFELDGKKWLSVEHYYQSSKFRKQNPDFSNLFSLNNKDSDISKSVDLALCAGSKTGRVIGKAKKQVKGNSTLLRPKTVEIDPDFYGERNQQERGKAVLAKFQQNEDLKNLLFNTKDAMLVRYVHGSPAEKDNILMNIRYKLLTMSEYVSR